MLDNLKKFNEWHEKHPGHFQDLKAEPWLAQWHEDALALSGPVAGLDVLEVGCGLGDFSIYLSKQGAKIIGTDFSTSAIAFAQKKCASRETSASFQLADAQALPFKNESFDLIFSCECLEHVPDPKKALSEMFRLLRPNGRLILTTENYSNGMLIYWLMALIKGEKFDSGSGVQPVEHFFLYWRVLRMMRKAGFVRRRILGAHYVFFAIPGIHPHTFVRERIKSAGLAKILRPFARHMSFELIKLA